jgi:hypothetical protein
MRSDSASAVLVMVCTSLFADGCASFGTSPNRVRLTTREREAAIARAQLWTKTNVAAMDLRAGPAGPGAFAPGQTVVCDYVDETATGHSPKFTCAIDGHDKVKVKYGRDNGEPFAEVAASRLLWALGFGADREYPVRVVCHACPGRLLGYANDPRELVFDVAAIERKLAGREIEGPEGRGWAWFELDWVDPSAGGATRAQRDALKLLAAVLQHTDSKREQQRLVCLDPAARSESREACRHTFMLINDLGETFGRAGALNLNATASVNLAAWERTPVWTHSEGCVGNLPQSWSGTLNNPRITEEGRAFLASLLTQLTDGQLLDLFEVARFGSRTHEGKPPAVDTSPAAWVRAFKSKVDQIASRSCAPVKADDAR